MSKVQSVERALSIIKTLYLNRDSMGITEISSELGLGKSTTHRLITTLEDFGFVQQDPKTSKYFLGWTLYEMGSMVPKRTGLDSAAKPFLQELCRQTGETTVLAIRDGLDTIYMNKAETNHIIRMDVQLGTRLPAYVTALGKAILSGMSDQEIRELYQGQELEMFTINTVGSLEHLLQEIHEVRLRKYAIDDEEYSIGFRCIAAPLRDNSGKVIAAISVVGPSSRLTKAKLVEDFPKVSAIAEQLSAALGYHA